MGYDERSRKCLLFLLTRTTPRRAPYSESPNTLNSVWPEGHQKHNSQCLGDSGNWRLDTHPSAGLTGITHAWWEVAKEILCFTECQRKSCGHEPEAEGWQKYSVHDKGWHPSATLGIVLKKHLTSYILSAWSFLFFLHYILIFVRILSHLWNPKAQQHALPMTMMTMLIMVETASIYWVPVIFQAPYWSLWTN